MHALPTEFRRLACLAAFVIAACTAPGGSGPAGSEPGASPRISCVGIPTERCDEAIASVELSLPNTVPVVIEVLCVSGSCTAESGAIDTVVTLADGSQLRSSTNSWSRAGPMPGNDKPLPQPAPAEAPAPPAPAVVPVEPVCQGVALSWCRTMAETAFGEVSIVDVVSILVRCTVPPCTDEHGTGDTLVTYADGTTQTSSWEYAGG